MLKTYKIGNNVKAILRFYTAGKIGDVTAEYDNQPYTVLNNIEANFVFESINSESKSVWRELNSNIDALTEVRLNNIELTNKILNLIYSKQEENLCNTMINLNSDDEGKIYFSLPSDEIYQVFIYDNDGQLEAAYGSYNSCEFIVNKTNSNYVIFYSYVSNNVYSLQKYNNILLKVDLEFTSNENDESKKAWIHLDKCSIAINKNMLFNSRINTIDLQLKIWHTDNDYIIFTAEDEE